MDLGHSPDTGASEGELRSGYALTPSPSHSKNISLFTERRTSERAVSKDGYSSFLFNPLWGFPVVAAGILFVVDHLTYGLYIDPPLGRAGMTEAQVRASGRKALIGKRPMSRIGRAIEKGDTQGFMKVLVDAASEEILGAAVLGVGGDEVIHSILDIMYAKVPYTVIQRAVHAHPTVSELIPTLLGGLKPLE